MSDRVELSFLATIRSATMKIIHHGRPQVEGTKNEVRQFGGGPRALKWRLIGLLGIALVAVIGVVGTYAYHFHGSFSADPKDWGPFGDYVGGILNPILAFCSFTALLATVYFQAHSLESAALALDSANKQLQLAKQNALEEAKRRDRETLKQDLHELLKAVHGELQALFTRPVDFAPGYTAGYFFSQSAPSSGEQQIPSNGMSVTPNDRTMILDLVDYLVQLNMFLKQYKDMIEPNPMTSYYAMRYMNAAKRLVTNGFLHEIMVDAVCDPSYGWGTSREHPGTP